MSVLYRNDRAGAYPESWYAETAPPPPARPGVAGDLRTDVAVIGAGYTGLSAALTLARRGLSVRVLEAHRVGFGASGRNGGQVSPGFNRDQRWLAARVGPEDARKLWDLTQEACALTRTLVADHAPDARYRPGVLHGAWDKAGAEDMRAYADWLAETYGAQSRYLDREAFQAVCASPVYAGGIMDPGAGHLHPLRLALGLARSAEDAGAVIHEGTEALSVTPGAPVRIATPRGTVTADKVLLAGNGYLPGLSRRYAARVMPINSFIAATAPLGDRADEVLTQDVAVSDDRFVVNYFRLSEDRRLLFGGRESYSIGFPRDILTALRARMTRLFPQLRGVEVTHHWGGTLGITMSRLPYAAQVDRGVLAAGGFSGQGVALSLQTGRIMGEVIAGDAAGLEVLSRLPVPGFPGGARFRAPLLTLAMTWYSLRDRLGI